MRHEEFTIEGSRDRSITADVTCDETRSHQPVLIFAHGFKGFKDWGYFNLLAQMLSSQGIVTVKFNFSYNGTTPENTNDITDFEAFGNNNLSTELNDLGLVIDCVYNGKLPIDKTIYNQHNITLMGHSRGGATVILKTAEDKRVKKLITLAALSEFGNFFGPDDYENWQSKGVMHVTNYRTGDRLPMYAQYIDDFNRNRDRLDVPARAAEVNVPWLCVHGAADYVVDVSHAKRLKEINSSLELILVSGASHTFNGAFPMSKTAATNNANWITRIIETIKAN